MSIQTFRHSTGWDMARRSSTTKAMMSFVRAIDRAAKEAERDRKRREREKERSLRQLEREQKAAAKQTAKEKKAAEKEAQQRLVEYAKEVFEERCADRRDARVEIENALLR